MWYTLAPLGPVEGGVTRALSAISLVVPPRVRVVVAQVEEHDVLHVVRVGHVLKIPLEAEPLPCVGVLLVLQERPAPALRAVQPSDDLTRLRVHLPSPAALPRPCS